jgi:beta-glucosidase
MGSAVDPASLGGAVRYAYEVSHVPVLVTEHGVATPDDGARKDALEPALDGLLDAMREGVPVLGYCHWTLMDNFEWISGFDSFLGLHAVDRETFARTAKPSAHEYARLVRAHSK